MSNSNLNPPPDLDPNQLTRLLELELAHKRAEWQHEQTRARKARANAIALLFLLVFGAAFALLYLYSRASEERAEHQTAPAAEATP